MILFCEQQLKFYVQVASESYTEYKACNGSYFIVRSASFSGSNNPHSLLITSQRFDNTQYFWKDLFFFQMSPAVSAEDVLYMAFILFCTWCSASCQTFYFVIYTLDVCSASHQTFYFQPCFSLLSALIVFILFKSRGQVWTSQWFFFLEHR